MLQLLQRVPCEGTRRASGASAYLLGPLSLRAAWEEVAGLLERSVYSKEVLKVLEQALSGR